MRNFYEILQIPQNASRNEVKLAYRRLALEFHPDVCPLPDASEKFIEINVAYEGIMQKLDYEDRMKIIREENETAQEIINAWLVTERERIKKRAQRHANMTYAQFKRSRLYKSSDVFPKTLAYMGLILGIVIISGSLYGTWNQYIVDSRVITANYLGSAILVFTLGIIMTIFAISRLLPFYRRS